MSLIHEALKKAEEQRRLGEPPSLGSPISRARERRSLLPFLLVAIVAAGGVGWWLTRPPAGTPAAPAPTAQAPASAPKTAPASAAPAAKPAGLERVAARSSAAEHTPVAEPRNPVLPPLGTPIPPGPQLLKTPRALAKERAERESAAMAPDGGKPGVAAKPGAASMKTAPVAKADKVPMPDTGPTTRPATAPPAPPPSVVASGEGESKDEHPAAKPGAAPDPNAPPLFWQLPYGVRKDLPALNVTMHVYSPDPAKRFVVINGDRKAEGDTLGSDISLREIRADGVVLEVHGQRFLVPRGGG